MVKTNLEYRKRKLNNPENSNFWPIRMEVYNVEQLKVTEILWAINN